MGCATLGGEAVGEDLRKVLLLTPRTPPQSLPPPSLPPPRTSSVAAVALPPPTLPPLPPPAKRRMRRCGGGRSPLLQQREGWVVSPDTPAAALQQQGGGGGVCVVVCDEVTYRGRPGVRRREQPACAGDDLACVPFPGCTRRRDQSPRRSTRAAGVVVGTVCACRCLHWGRKCVPETLPNSGTRVRVPVRKESGPLRKRSPKHDPQNWFLFFHFRFHISSSTASTSSKFYGSSSYHTRLTRAIERVTLA